jgi:hypothetical protein
VRVLLDEQLPRQLARHLAGHDIRTVQEQLLRSSRPERAEVTAWIANLSTAGRDDRRIRRIAYVEVKACGHLSGERDDVPSQCIRLRSGGTRSPVSTRARAARA